MIFGASLNYFEKFGSQVKASKNKLNIKIRYSSVIPE
jgi:hypothetical protein